MVCSLSMKATTANKNWHGAMHSLVKKIAKVLLHM